MCVFVLWVLMSQCLFDEMGEWGVEGQPVLARHSLFLHCLLSLCILWRVHLSLSLAVSLCFYSSSSPSCFSPFLYAVMPSKGTHGTVLGACARSIQGQNATKLATAKKKKKSRAAAVSVSFFPDRLKTVFWWPFARDQLSQSMLSFIFTYGNHRDKLMFTEKRITSERSMSGLTSPAAVRGSVCWRHFQ